MCARQLRLHDQKSTAGRNRATAVAKQRQAVRFVPIVDHMRQHVHVGTGRVLRGARRNPYPATMRRLAQAAELNDADRTTLLAGTAIDDTPTPRRTTKPCGARAPRRPRPPRSARTRGGGCAWSPLRDGAVGQQECALLIPAGCASERNWLGEVVRPQFVAQARPV
jgi:hypothetical protein